MKNPPKFYGRIEQFNGKKILRIWDASDSYTAMSVTNGAEYVLNELEKENGILPDIIIYKDTDKHWSRMIRDTDGNVTFASIVAGKPGKYDDDVAANLATGGKE